jgi:hypothetical protein
MNYSNLTFLENFLSGWNFDFTVTLNKAMPEVGIETSNHLDLNVVILMNYDPTPFLRLYLRGADLQNNDKSPGFRYHEFRCPHGGYYITEFTDPKKLCTIILYLEIFFDECDGNVGRFIQRLGDTDRLYSTRCRQ